jgi:hypothetical protein
MDEGYSFQKWWLESGNAHEGDNEIKEWARAGWHARSRCDKPAVASAPERPGMEEVAPEIPETDDLLRYMADPVWRYSDWTLVILYNEIKRRVVLHKKARENLIADLAAFANRLVVPKCSLEVLLSLLDSDAGREEGR